MSNDLDLNGPNLDSLYVLGKALQLISFLDKQEARICIARLRTLNECRGDSVHRPKNWLIESIFVNRKDIG